MVPCRKWQECIDRDPTNVRRMAVIAEIFGDIFDSFVRPMSFKTVVGRVYSGSSIAVDTSG